MASRDAGTWVGFTCLAALHDRCSRTIIQMVRIVDILFNIFKFSFMDPVAQGPTPCLLGALAHCDSSLACFAKFVQGPSGGGQVKKQHDWV